MTAFEVTLNRETVTVAGKDDLGVLTAIVSAVGVLGRASSGTQGKASGYDLDLQVGGLTSKGKGRPDEHLS